MAKILYVPKSFKAAALGKIDQANAIIEDYASQGFDLTLRQLYYQFVSRGWIPNNQREYDNLGVLISDARLAGLIDWEAISDRTRHLRSRASWSSPSGIVRACAEQFHYDYWETQKYRPEVWIEKDALVGVIAQACDRLDVPYFSCRGYTSQSEMWRAAMRIKGYVDKGKIPVIFHLGDHDPSGMDMSRDILERIEMFLRVDSSDSPVVFKRLALNMDQVNKYNPPPNPAKVTDSRAAGYIDEFGSDSWELDALDPKTLTDLVTLNVAGITDPKAMAKIAAEEKNARRSLTRVADRWLDVMKAVTEV